MKTKAKLLTLATVCATILLLSILLSNYRYRMSFVQDYASSSLSVALADLCRDKRVRSVVVSTPKSIYEDRFRGGEIPSCSKRARVYVGDGNETKVSVVIHNPLVDGRSFLSMPFSALTTIVYLSYIDNNIVDTEMLVTSPL